MIIIAITFKDFIPSPTYVFATIRAFRATHITARQRLDVFKQQGFFLRLRAVCPITNVAHGYHCRKCKRHENFLFHNCKILIVNEYST